MDRRVLANCGERALREDGFSLLEIMVALALMALTLTLVSANAVQMLGRWQESSEFRDVRNRISGLRVRAYVAQQPFNLDPSSVGVLGLNEGWSVETDTPVRYLATGTCLGGALRITAPSGRSELIRLDPPDCVARAG
ncbi:MAG: prepilin-type N-terminal cleavage/methylation domain-containing protein [Pseudomonadota bacterium]